AGRSTSVGHETNLSTTGRRLSNSRRQSEQAAMCACIAGASLAGRACRAWAHASSALSQSFGGACELGMSLKRQTRAFGLVRAENLSALASRQAKTGNHAGGHAAAIRPHP